MQPDNSSYNTRTLVQYGTVPAELAFYAVSIHHIHAPALIFDAAGTVLGYNHIAQRLIAVPATQHQPAQLQADFWSQIAAHLPTTTPLLNVPVRVEHHTTSVNIQPIYNASGQRLGALLLLQLAPPIGASPYEQRLLEQHETLRVAVAAINAELDQQQLLTRLVEQAVRTTNADEGILSLVDESQRELEVVVSMGQPNIPVGTRISLDQGGIAIVARTRQPLLIPDYTRWQHSIPQYRNLANRRILIMPLVRGGTVIGLLTVANRIERHRFDLDDIELLSILAQQATIAIQNAHLYNAARRRAEEAETLRRAVTVVTARLDRTATIESILDQLALVVPYTSASVQLRDGDFSEILGGRGFPDKDVVGFRIPIVPDNPGSDVYQTQQPVIIRDVQEFSSRFRTTYWGYIRSWLGVPLIVHDNVIGILTIDHHQPNFYTSDHARVAQAFADQVAIALENARLFARVQYLATTDALTRLYNRHYFFELATDRFAQSQRAHQPISAIMLDVDNFKQINDTYGHLTGDQVLREVAGVLRHAVRGEHLVCRYGGEELLILLPDTPAAPAFELAETIRRAVVELHLPHHPELVITASLGVATSLANAPAHHRWTLAQLIDHSDKAMYEAKRSGKNQVQAWHTTADQTSSPPSIRTNPSTRALIRVAAQLHQQTDLAAMLDLICTETCTLLQVPAAAVLHLEPATELLHCVALRGFAGLRPPDLPPVPTSFASELRTVDHCYIEPDIRQIPGAADSILVTQHGMRQLVAAPVEYAEQMLGALLIFERRTQREFQPEELELLHHLGQRLALAISYQHSMGTLLPPATRLPPDPLLAADSYGTAHKRRMLHLMLRLARALHLPSEELPVVRWGTLLYDVERLGIPNGLLAKDAPLTASEYDLLCRHLSFAHDLVSPLEFLAPALQIARSYREHWDGSGSPQGLRGTQIPLTARMFAVVHTWDALTYERPFRPGWSSDDVLDYLEHNAGTYFDPEVVAAFIGMRL